MRAKEICLLASRVAKGGTGMVDIAGQWLNIVLEDLKLNKNLKVNRVTQILNFPAGTFGPLALEADYLRTYDLFYQIPSVGGITGSSQTLFLNPVTMEQFDAEFKDTQETNYPYEYATDLSTQAQVWSGGAQGNGSLSSAGGIYIYPASSGVLALTHRYMKNQPDIVTPSVSNLEPWFAYTEYLITATAAGMMGVTGDDRSDAYRARAQDMLRPHLIMEGDEQQTVQNVRLDPRHFRFNRGLKPTKASPF
jgi:hypothetical protein